MLLKKTGFLFIAFGILGMVVSLFSGFIGSGQIQMGPAKWLGAQAGFVIVLVGIALVMMQKDSAVQIPSMFKNAGNFVVNQPVISWTVLGFLVTYFLFFVAPVFFDSRLQFHYLEGYLPSDGRLGLDLRAITHYLNIWLLQGKSPYFNHVIFYPPLYNIMMAPITLLPYPQSYYFMVGISILAYIVYTWVLPLRLNDGKNYGLLILFFGTGLFSYGLQLELERGQFNAIAFLCCMLAIYLFHYHEKYRFFAYVFFTIAVQLKVFPMIFIFMFITDWRDWKANIKRFIGLGLVNFLLLFALGYSIFIDYISSSMAQVSQKGVWAWAGNHSIKSFVYLLGRSDKIGLGLENGMALNWISQNSGLLEGVLLLYVALCLLIVLVFLYLRRERGFNAYLLLACTIVSMVAAPISNDYKLVILAAPMAIAFSRLKQQEGSLKKLLAGGLIFYASFAYSATLYSFKYRPGFLASSLPFLLIILTIITILYLLSQNRPETKPELVVMPETANA